MGGMLSMALTFTLKREKVNWSKLMKKYAYFTLGSVVAFALILYTGYQGTMVIKSKINNYIESRIEKTLSRIDKAIEWDALNLLRARNRVASEESAQFINKFMSDVTSFPDKPALLKESIRNVDRRINGLYCEFGVGSGTTVNYIASIVDTQQVQVHGFDSFEGLPEDYLDGLPKGTFKMGELPRVRSNVVLHKGWFNQSLPAFKKAYNAPLSFLHMDADLYSSTKTVFDILGDRIVPGTVIQFDEFFNHPGWKDHEYKAFVEFVESYKVKYQFIGYTPIQQVAVKILEISKPQ